MAKALPTRDLQGRVYDPSIYNQAYFEGESSNYDNYQNCEGIVRDQFKIIHEVMWPRVELKKHLDIGCAYGFGVDEMFQRMWDSSGADVSGFAVEKALAFGNKFKVADATDEKFWEVQEPVGLITAIEFFEHIPSDLAQSVIKWMSVRSQWGVYVINAQTHPGENTEQIKSDHGHLNFNSMAWWVTEFAKYGEVDFLAMHELNKRFEDYNPGVMWHGRTVVVKYD